MANDSDERIRANLKVHEHEARDFDAMHPELFSKVENETIREVIKEIKQRTSYKPSVDVLDIACGSGRLSLPFLENDFSVTACDLSPDMLAVFQKKLDKRSQGKLNIINSDINSFLEHNRTTFDCVVIGAFLHHIENIEDFLKKILAFLKPNGFLFIVHEPALRQSNQHGWGYVLEKIDSVLFQIKYLFTRFKVLPRVKEYGSSEIHTRNGINDIKLLAWFEEFGFHIVKYKRYYSHKVPFITFLDRTFFHFLPQFFILAQGGNDHAP
jgi:2-polyprenyl-3-methyl-5-hydroxy-6-metoxy-1,4-benzoquinol methylase